MIETVSEHKIDRRAYTEDQLYDFAKQGLLPGLTRETTFGAHIFRNTLWTPIYNKNVVLENSNGELCIVTGIREPGTNKTHEDVLSTPTLRITQYQAQEITAQASSHLEKAGSFVHEKVSPMKPERIAAYGAHIMSLKEPNSLASVGMDLSRKKLRKKLGFFTLGGRKWRNNGTISLSVVVSGFSHVGKTSTGEDLLEALIMLGSVTAAAQGGSLPLASRTKHYRSISLTPIDTFEENVRKKNLEGLSPRAKPRDVAGVCVKGVCLATSIETIHNNIRGHAGYPDML